MSIHTEELREVSGFDKSIDPSALGMIYDNLQAYQYQYPEKSTVRELVSNALDSVKERQIAQEILSGKAKEADYYLRREEEVYQASNFNPAYYDLKYLSSENRVFVDYYEGAESQRDHIEITDKGVGLGGKRLQGYFMLGYSSKRNTKFALGKFGIGAKSPLSTGVDCYYVESRYNGLLTKWNIYSAKINSLVPRFNLENGKENVRLLFDGVEVYAEDHNDVTPCHNYTKIVIQVKKHKKQAYLDAVKSQLMYFNNVELRLHNVDGTGFSELIPIKAQIVYEDEHLLVAKNTLYNKPHVILNGVNYGLIDFKELELEEKHGNVGIKIPAEGVTVNPSRENVIWNDKTRETVLRSFELAVGAASAMVQDRLKTTDIWEWHRTLEQAKGRLYNRENDSDALGVLSKIVDVEKIDFSFQPDPRIGVGERSLWGIHYQLYYLDTTEEKKGKKTVRKTKLTHSDRTVVYGFDPDVAIVYLQGDDIRPHIRTIRYLLSLPDYRAVALFRRQRNQEFRVDDAHKYLDEGVKTHELTIYCGPYFFGNALKDKVMSKHLTKGRELHDLAEIQENVFKFIEASPRTKTMESIEVPATYKTTYTINDEEEEIIDEEPEKPERISPEDLRKAQGRVYMRTPKYERGKAEMHGVEPNLLEMDSWKNTYYATQENQVQLEIAAALSINAANNHIRNTPPHKLGETVKVTNQGIYDVTWRAHPVDGRGEGQTQIVNPPFMTDMTHTEREKIINDVENLTSQWNSCAPYYWTPSIDGSGTVESFKQPLVRFILVAKDLVKKLPTHVRPIQEYYLSFTPNKEITMSNILANWYLANMIKETLEETKSFSDSSFFENQRIKAIVQDLRIFVATWGRTNLSHLLKESDQEQLENVTNFMERVLKFQQFVSLHHTEPELIAAQAKHLFGNSDIKGAVAFDMAVYNKIAELQEYWNQAGWFLAKIKWSYVDNKTADLLREISHIKGWEPWTFEAPYPISTPDQQTSNSTPDEH